jgi:hypothetical protein
MTLPQHRFLRVHGRNFMELDLAPGALLPSGKPGYSALIDSWSERKQDEAASLISTAYQGHIDSEINDQYRSPAGARRFLLNIIQYPGCGSFFQPASFLALERRTGSFAGCVSAAWCKPTSVTSPRYACRKRSVEPG